VTKIFTPEVRARIPDMVEQGMTIDEIAAQLGCKRSTLVVKCSHHQISLRRGGRRHRLRAAPDRKTPLQLSKVAVIKFHLQAERRQRDIDVLAKSLLEIIARDNLFDAVLDETEPA
jgi:transposase-like protein